MGVEKLDNRDVRTVSNTLRGGSTKGLIAPLVVVTIGALLMAASLVFKKIEEKERLAQTPGRPASLIKAAPAAPSVPGGASGGGR